MRGKEEYDKVKPKKAKDMPRRHVKVGEKRIKSYLENISCERT